MKWRWYNGHNSESVMEMNDIFKTQQKKSNFKASSSSKPGNRCEGLHIFSWQGGLYNYGNYALRSPSSQGGSLMTVTTQSAVQSRKRPGRDYTMHSLSGQAKRLDPRNAQRIVGSSLVFAFCNSKCQACGLSLQIMQCQLCKVRSGRGKPRSAQGKCRNKQIWEIMWI